MTELQRRVAVAAVAIPVVFGLIWIGDAALASLLAIAAALGAWEACRLARHAGLQPLEVIAVPAAGLLPLAVHAQYLGLITWSPAAIVAVFLLCCAGALSSRPIEAHPFGAAAVTVFIVVYVAGTLDFAYALRYHEYVVERGAGTALLFFPVILTWASDTGAYFIGKAIGRHKLMPRVSPGKTVEGGVGGLLLAAAVAVPYVRYVLQPVAHLGIGDQAAIGFAMLVSVAGQMGDLFESLLKREAGVKDSSHLIPGHGGVLDRLDSLYFALPLSYLLLGGLLRYSP